jgi:hypothetical protein
MRLPTEDDGPAYSDPLVVASIDDVQAEFKERSEMNYFARQSRLSLRPSRQTASTRRT